MEILALRPAAARAARGRAPRRDVRPARRVAAAPTARRTRPSRWRTRCCPGSRVAALAGAPLLLGAAGGVLVAAALIALAARDRRDRRRARRRRDGHDGVRRSASLLALAPDAPARLGELLFGDLLGASDGGPRRRRGARRLRRARARRRPPPADARPPSTRCAAPSLGVRPARVELGAARAARARRRRRRPGPRQPARRSRCSSRPAAAAIRARAAARRRSSRSPPRSARWRGALGSSPPTGSTLAAGASVALAAVRSSRCRRAAARRARRRAARVRRSPIEALGG